VRCAFVRNLTAVKASQYRVKHIEGEELCRDKRAALRLLRKFYFGEIDDIWMIREGAELKLSKSVQRRLWREAKA
jgi:hypothetical protein